MTVKRLLVRDSSGAALLELVLVLPLILGLLLLPLIEYGSVSDEKMVAQEMASDAARSEGILGTNAAVDLFSLKAAMAAGNSLHNSQVVAIIIYKPNASGLPQPHCFSGSPNPADKCNYYKYPNFTTYDTSDFAPQGGPCGGYVDKNLCPGDPNDRNNQYASSAAGPDPDNIGVWVILKHKSITGLLYNNASITAHTVVQLDPDTRV
jgi:hypothetical protein